MRAGVVIAGGILALAACGQPAKKAEPTPAEKVAMTPVVSDAATTPGGPLSAVDLRRVCRAGLAAIHGQEPTAIQINGLEGSVVNAQWPAPVDGGVLKAQCRVDGELLTWKPLELPDPAASRWMNQSGDPVNTFAIKGDVVTVTQTFDDGTNQQSDLTVPASKEAA
ncbi:hypothetical protein BH10PSE1_BH10PSE1_27210 [soil metagenome]